MEEITNNYGPDSSESVEEGSVAHVEKILNVRLMADEVRLPISVLRVQSQIATS